MPIDAKLNDNYDPVGSVSQKYTPLDRKSLKVTSSKEIDSIIKVRQDFFKELTGTQKQDNPVKIKYYGDSIDTIFDLELQKTKNAKQAIPPLAVISSNRSGWIAKQYENLKQYLENNSIENSIVDIKVLNDAPIPIYFPERLDKVGSESRGVYIFVHKTEYDTYVENLKKCTGIKVIGWDFPDCSKSFWSPLLGNLKSTMFGFGVSRFAALEFFKYLFKKGKELTPSRSNICSKIWMLDDNLIYLIGEQNLTYFEQKIPGNDANNPIVGIGFKGDDAPSLYSKDWNRNWFPKKMNWSPGKPVLLHQMMLWNIDYFHEWAYDFSPFFITAGEDISFTQYNLKYDNNSCKIDENFLIKKVKLQPQDYDNTPIRASFEEHKLYELRQLFDKEKATQINDTSKKSIIIEKLLENLLKKFKGIESESVTISKAIEQILRTGINSSKLTNKKLPPYDSLFNIKTNVQLQNT